MRSLLLRHLVLVALGASAAAAHADNGLLYLGAGISRDSLRNITANHDLDSTSWKAMAGFRPISLFAVEADYIDLGTQKINGFGNTESTRTRFRYKAVAGYAVGFAPIPVPFLDVFGKVGLARWTASGGTTFTSYDPELGTPLGSSFSSLSDKGTQFAWGIGAQMHVGNIGGRLEYENFNIRNTNGANVISLSVFLNLF
jgi:Outer membrane protein beta-barrel domain